MPRRELFTIGDLGPRSRMRTRGRSIKHPLWGMGALGLLPDTAPGGTDLQIAADALARWYSSHAPSTAQVAEVANFQLAWNAHPIEGSGITVDGKFGGNTEGAYAITVDHYGLGSSIPRNAYGATRAAIPAMDPGEPAVSPTLPTLPRVTPSAVTPAAPIVQTEDSNGWILPVAIGAAALGGLVWLFKKRKRGGARRRSSGHLLTVRTNPMRRCM